ncbi:hypothetical protein F4778DRAFT_59947 [Xylariomycetidae sp. FL2044]|nr:hypothetical protein F4778DRAFT_59947 [Xylariomycetidae sp. FL2044]
MLPLFHRASPRRTRSLLIRARASVFAGTGRSAHAGCKLEIMQSTAGSQYDTILLTGPEPGFHIILTRASGAHKHTSTQTHKQTGAECIIHPDLQQQERIERAGEPPSSSITTKTKRRGGGAFQPFLRETNIPRLESGRINTKIHDVLPPQHSSNSSSGPSSDDDPFSLERESPGRDIDGVPPHQASPTTKHLQAHATAATWFKVKGVDLLIHR